MFTGMQATFPSDAVSEYGEGRPFKQRQNAAVTQQGESEVAWSPTELSPSGSGTLEVISDMFCVFQLFQIFQRTIVFAGISRPLRC